MHISVVRFVMHTPWLGQDQTPLEITMERADKPAAIVGEVK